MKRVLCLIGSLAAIVIVARLRLAHRAWCDKAISWLSRPPYCRKVAVHCARRKLSLRQLAIVVGVKSINHILRRLEGCVQPSGRTRSLQLLQSQEAVAIAHRGYVADSVVSGQRG